MAHGQSFTFDDPYELQATLRAGNYEVLPVSSGIFYSDLTRIDFDRLWLQRCGTSANVILHTANHPTRAPMTFLADLEQGPWQQNGEELPSDGIAVYQPGAVNHHIARGPNRWASMSLTPDDLAKQGEAIAGRELTPPRETYIARPGAALMARLRALHAAACKLSRENPEALAHPASAKALEQDLIYVMVSCLTAAAPASASPRMLRCTKVISRFEDYLAERKFEPVYVGEICAAIEVSGSMLRSVCREHLGMGPVRYLWLRRMHLSRQALLQADAVRRTVTDVATEHGFWELGRFSVEYRQLFGESPSATLKRSLGGSAARAPRQH